MTSLKAVLLGCALLLATGAAVWAEDHGALGRALELPAHKALIERREMPGTTLSQFASDGCSGGLSEVWRLAAGQFAGFARIHTTAPPWESCCVTHDRAYFDGTQATSAAASFAARLEADRALETCVIDVAINRRDELAVIYGIRPQQVEAAYATIGGAMFWAVRFGGGPCTGLSWRWGFGYPKCSDPGGNEG